MRRYLHYKHLANIFQDWLYEDGEDASKAAYIAKQDEIRFIAGPIIGRYQEKIDNERQAREEAEAKRRAEAEAVAKAKAEEEAKAKQAAEAESKDTEMKDAGADQPQADVEEMD